MGLCLGLEGGWVLRQEAKLVLFSDSETKPVVFALLVVLEVPYLSACAFWLWWTVWWSLLWMQTEVNNIRWSNACGHGWWWRVWLWVGLALSHNGCLSWRKKGRTFDTRRSVSQTDKPESPASHLMRASARNKNSSSHRTSSTVSSSQQTE